MKRNSRLSLALHTLGHMASDPQLKRTSAEIAEHVGTNPVVVRRVLGKLRKAGLLKSEKGYSGGWLLARKPQDVTLADVYLALEERMIATDGASEATACSIENALHECITNVLEEIEESLVRRLAETSISEMRGS